MGGFLSRQAYEPDTIIRDLKEELDKQRTENKRLRTLLKEAEEIISLSHRPELRKQRTNLVRRIWTKMAKWSH